MEVNGQHHIPATLHTCRKSLIITNGLAGKRTGVEVLEKKKISCPT